MRKRRTEPGKVIGHELDEISQVKTPIRLITDRMTFYARVGEATKEDKDGDVVRKWVRTEMKKVRNVSWTPIIVVDYASTAKPELPWFNGRKIEGAKVGALDFTARRSYVAPMGNAVRELDWDDYEANPDPAVRVDESYPFGYPTSVLSNLPWHLKRRWKDDKIEAVFAYDETLWAGIVTIVESIERSRVSLKQILSRAGDAQAFLSLVGSGKAPIASLMPGKPVQEDSDGENDDSDDDEAFGR